MHKFACLLIHACLRKYVSRPIGMWLHLQDDHNPPKRSQTMQSLGLS